MARCTGARHHGDPETILGAGSSMHLLLPVAALALVGWVVAFPFVTRGTTDVRRIPGSVWRITGYHSRRNWRVAMWGGYLLGGWPGMAVVLSWRRSDTRETLRDEWHLLIEERRARREIVLARYEDDGGDGSDDASG
jgi:hypothetical protein